MSTSHAIQTSSEQCSVGSCWPGGDLMQDTAEYSVLTFLNRGGIRTNVNVVGCERFIRYLPLLNSVV